MEKFHNYLVDFIYFRYGLKRVLTNEEYARSKCAKCRTLTRSHCKRCAVAVAQSKMGVCLQFEWRHW